jgi:uncharacterized DUF497 family protein
MGMDDAFEWDGQKAGANFAKHGGSFERATFAFYDVFVVELPTSGETTTKSASA